MNLTDAQVHAQIAREARSSAARYDALAEDCDDDAMRWHYHDAACADRETAALHEGGAV